MVRRFVIWGASGHAKVVAGVVRRIGGVISATIDKRPDVPCIFGAPAFRGPNAFEGWLSTVPNPSEYSGVICIGGAHGDERIKVLTQMRNAGLNLSPLIDPNAFVDDSASLGEGSQVLPGAVVAAEASIGNACIINHRASIDHESSIGNGVHVAPGATVCGLVTIDTAAFVGAGSVVLPRLSIGAHARVGAGAVVTRNVASYSTVVGNPAKLINRNQL